MGTDQIQRRIYPEIPQCKKRVEVFVEEGLGATRPRYLRILDISYHYADFHQ